MFSEDQCRPAVRAGYALPMTLAAIIVIALVCAVAAEQLRASTASVSRLADQVQTRASLISAEQTLIYLILTEPMSARGVEVGGRGDAMIGVDTTSSVPVSANGAAFRPSEEGAAIVRLLSSQSFLNLASTNFQGLSRALTLLGVPASEHQAMFAALQDYQDEDNLRRLGGAEASEYDEDGLPPNQPLRHVLEVCAVQGWSESEVCADRSRLLMLTGLRNGDGLSPRLASKILLSEILPDPEEAAYAFERYAAGDWRTFDQIGAPEFDAVTDPLAGSSFPGPTLTIISHSPDGQNARRTELEITPSSLQSPFRIKSRYVISGPYAQSALRIENPADATPLPQPPGDASRR